LKKCSTFIFKDLPTLQDEKELCSFDALGYVKFITTQHNIPKPESSTPTQQEHQKL
jgi:hypothetical protein